MLKGPGPIGQIRERDQWAVLCLTKRGSQMCSTQGPASYRQQLGRVSLRGDAWRYRAQHERCVCLDDRMSRRGGDVHLAELHAMLRVNNYGTYDGGGGTGHCATEQIRRDSIIKPHSLSTIVTSFTLLKILRH